MLSLPLLLDGRMLRFGRLLRSHSIASAATRRSSSDDAADPDGYVAAARHGQIDHRMAPRTHGHWSAVTGNGRSNACSFASNRSSRSSDKRADASTIAMPLIAISTRERRRRIKSRRRPAANRRYLPLGGYKAPLSASNVVTRRAKALGSRGRSPSCTRARSRSVAAASPMSAVSPTLPASFSISL